MYKIRSVVAALSAATVISTSCLVVPALAEELVVEGTGAQDDIPVGDPDVLPDASAGGSVSQDQTPVETPVCLVSQAESSEGSGQIESLGTTGVGDDSAPDAIAGAGDVDDVPTNASADTPTAVDAPAEDDRIAESSSDVAPMDVDAPDASDDIPTALDAPVIDTALGSLDESSSIGTLELDEPIALADQGASASGWTLENDSTYYYGADGAKLTGLQTIDGATYYLDETTGALITGEQQLDAAWYYFDPANGGARSESSFVYLDGAYLISGAKTVYYDADGRMLYGEQELDGFWYYLDFGTGARSEASFVYLDGAYLINGPKTVYYDADGKMVYGEQQVDDSWYYLDKGTGARAESKFVYLNDDYLADGPKTVYYGSDGKMVYGEQQVGSSWYYLYPGSGARAENTYVYLDGDYLVGGAKYVYYGSDGAMYHGAHVIDGYTRWFDLGTGATDKIGYQNPIGYFQVSANNVTLSAAANASKYSFLKYVTPSAISIDATRDDCVEAFINRAYDYLGTTYAWDYAAAPGVGVDCSGLVMQALYATGMDLGDYNPYAHYTDSYHDHDATNMLNDSRFAAVSLDDRQRGDLVFWKGHVGIYLGNDQIIDAYPPDVEVRSLWSYGTPIAVKRVFL